MRALKLLESFVGKYAVVALIHEVYETDVSFHTCPKSAEPILLLREKVNAEIKKYI